MTITATLTDSGQRHLGRAVGIGNTQSDAVQAVLHSREDQESIATLGESVRETLSDSGALEADFEDSGWAVHIQWW